ncbi:nucleotide-sugar uncharacterized transporter 1-like [Glycine soja]|uniref:nucleotide-sugar uncharacterized transporter 1-like n=1 Tax=Glycine soja TaxID=3848 RepID=UPI00103A8ADC|nr:nucleotide-sugar uncharacterized transporter 1-like [Glycine soja]
MVLMWKTTSITLIFLAAMSPCLDPPAVLSFGWNFINTLGILTSAFLGFLLQWSGALALGATSAVLHVVLEQFKTCIILLGNYYLFGFNPGIISICGAFAAIADSNLTILGVDGLCSNTIYYQSRTRIQWFYYTWQLLLKLEYLYVNE